ncbi:MAG: hypothetical protein QOF73_1880, partial [Thermomicrobiales bacterium]|nr:hypothetical protein [Thermomicrobiales bacterium]
MSWLHVNRSIVRGALLMLLTLGILAGSGVVQQGQADAQESNGLHRAMKNA